MVGPSSIDKAGTGSLAAREERVAWKEENLQKKIAGGGTRESRLVVLKRTRRGRRRKARGTMEQKRGLVPCPLACHRGWNQARRESMVRGNELSNFYFVKRDCEGQRKGKGKKHFKGTQESQEGGRLVWGDEG